MKSFYEVNIPLPKYGYSFGIEIENDKPLSDKEVLDIAYYTNRFENDNDINVASVIPISEKDYRTNY